jgi:hypothetical protein
MANRIGMDSKLTSNRADLPVFGEEQMTNRARPANTMVDGSEQPGIGYFAALAA